MHRLIIMREIEVQKAIPITTTNPIMEKIRKRQCQECGLLRYVLQLHFSSWPIAFILVEIRSLPPYYVHYSKTLMHFLATFQEDRMLLKILETTQEPVKWPMIAKSVPGRSGKVGFSF
mmetsp:Transcript_39622/g.57863  ORF Transcript_39622/g.57863 Transcript_39622/m.57863 type:complete len:118 (+) Transcript_39622:328-681(+)